MLATALAAVTTTGCEERERWPEPSRVRSRPKPILPYREEELCPHGSFCLPPPASVPAPAPPPFAYCPSSVPLPTTAATELPEPRRQTLRVRFDADATAAAPAAPTCCFFWFEDCI